MKFLRPILLALATLFTVVPAVAQNHVIKITPGKLLGPVNNLQLGYEGVVSEKVTLGVDLKIAFPSSATDIPFDLDTLAVGESGTFETFGLSSGWSVTPQVRFYLGKSGAPKGFYLNPWLRFFRYSLDSEVVWTEPAGDSDIDAQFTYGGFGGGFNIGWQWFLGDAFVIDWNFGLGALPTRLGISGSVTGPLADDVQEFIDEVNNQLDEAPLISGQFEGDAGSLQGNTNYFIMPVFRSNLSIGYAF